MTETPNGLSNGIHIERVEIGDIKLAVRSQVGTDAMKRGTLIRIMPRIDADDHMALTVALRFCDCVLQTVEVEGLPFEWTMGGKNINAIHAMFEGWSELPFGVLRAWDIALARADNFLSRATRQNGSGRKSTRGTKSGVSSDTPPSTPTPTNEPDTTESVSEPSPVG